MFSLCSPSESDLQIGVASTLNLLICSLVGKWPTTLVKQMFLSEMLPSAWFLKPMWSMELITKAVNDIFSIYQTLLLSRGKNP
ncbi:uncharacterized protein LOC126715327 isoform X2 [Quercus robur]|uniref:uncharacterized protein LOC126715327 isoform X2 n=1 Tax=Quercus robur TaxID=38942 RepID=UPI0021626693|nr:uncharacterized protein LOC126715327 isoform X2 [Quercus robur]